MSCGRSSPIKPYQALDVVGEIGHADLDLGPGHTDGADRQAHAMLSPGEHQKLRLFENQKPWQGQQLGR